MECRDNLFFSSLFFPTSSLLFFTYALVLYFYFSSTVLFSCFFLLFASCLQLDFTCLSLPHFVLHFPSLLDSSLPVSSFLYILFSAFCVQKYIIATFAQHIPLPFARQGCTTPKDMLLSETFTLLVTVALWAET